MRGHWISTTRKLNRHYQSGTPGTVATAWSNFNLPIDHAGLTWGVDHNDSRMFASLPTWFTNCRRFEVELELEATNLGSALLYLCYAGIEFSLYDANSQAQLYTYYYWSPYSQYVPTPTLRTNLAYTTFTDIWGNPTTGEQFVYDPISGKYKLTTHLVIDTQTIDPTNTGLGNSVRVQSLFRSTVTPNNSIITGRMRIKKL